MSEHPPSCTCNTLTEWNHITSFVKGVVFDLDIRVSHIDDLPQMFSCPVYSIAALKQPSSYNFTLRRIPGYHLGFVDLKSGLKKYQGKHRS